MISEKKTSIIFERFYLWIANTIHILNSIYQFSIDNCQTVSNEIGSCMSIFFSITFFRSVVFVFVPIEILCAELDLWCEHIFPTWDLNDGSKGALCSQLLSLTRAVENISIHLCDDNRINFLISTHHLMQYVKHRKMVERELTSQQHTDELRALSVVCCCWVISSFDTAFRNGMNCNGSLLIYPYLFFHSHWSVNSSRCWLLFFGSMMEKGRKKLMMRKCFVDEIKETFDEEE